MLRDVEGRGGHGRASRAGSIGRVTGEPIGRGVDPHRTDARRPPPRYPRVPRARPYHGDRPTRDRTRGPSSTSTRGPHRGRRRDLATPILVRQLRNGIEESVHRGDIVEADASRRARSAVLGDPDRIVTLRSTVKPFGAVALIEAGGVAAFDLQPAEIAILASSHSGEDLHVRTLQGMFRRVGRRARRCSPAAPRGCRSMR